MKRYLFQNIKVIQGCVKPLKGYGRIKYISMPLHPKRNGVFVCVKLCVCLQQCCIPLRNFAYIGKSFALFQETFCLFGKFGFPLETLHSLKGFLKEYQTFASEHIRSFLQANGKRFLWKKQMLRGNHNI